MLLLQRRGARHRIDGGGAGRGGRNRAAAAFHNAEEVRRLPAHETLGDNPRRRARPRGQTLGIVAAPERGRAEIVHRHMREIVTPGVGDREFAEHVVEDRGRRLDGVVALHEASRLEAREGEGVDVFLQRHAVLQAERDRDGEVVHHRPEGRALLVHVDEDLAEAAVLVFAGAQVNLVPADDRLLGVALAAARQLLALAHLLDALDDALDDLLRDLRHPRGGRHGNQRLDRVVRILFFVFDQRRIQRLAELRAVAVEGVRLQRELPREQVGRFAILDRGLVRHVDRLRDRARDEGLRRRHHADVALHREVALAEAPAGVRAIEHRIVLELEVRRAFQRHRAADMDVRGLDVLLREAEEGQELEGHVRELGIGHAESLHRLIAEGPAVEGELDVEGRGEGLLELLQHLVGETLGLQRGVVDARRLPDRPVTDGIGLDLADLRLGIAERAQSRQRGLVDDLEVAAAGQLLELHQREIGLDAGGVAIHHETDGAGGGDHGRLGVAVAVLHTERERLIPRGDGVVDEVRDRAVGAIERHRVDGEALVALRLAFGGAGVVADNAQHMRRVLLVAGESADFSGDFRRGLVAHAGHQRGQRTAERTALFRVVGEAHGHQQAADVGVAEAERAKLVGEFGDFLRGELRHQHGDLEHQRPEADGVLIGLDVEDARFGIVVLQQVHRREIACGVIEEHVFRARIGRVDPARRGAGVPIVHRGVEVQARIRRGPGGIADLLPEVAGLKGLDDLAILAGGEVPLAAGFHGAQELVVQRDRVVRILTGDGEISLRIPIGVVGVELEILVALLGELDDALDVVIRHHHLAGGLDLALENRVLLGIEAGIARTFAVEAGAHDGFQRLGVDLGAGDERRNLLLFLHLPVDIGLDIRVIGVDDDHLRRAARGAAGLDRARRTVADLEEAHQARGAAAAGEALAFTAQGREVRAGARAILEEARLANPEVHDAAFVDEIVLHALDEAGMRLRMLVGGFRLRQLAGLVVDIIVALAGAIDAIGPMQAGVEPLRRIRRATLRRQHEAHFVVEGLGVGLGGEIATLPAPVGPAAGEAVGDFLHRGLGAVALLLGQGGEGSLIRDRAPEERGNVVLLDLLQPGRDTGLAEILLREHVRGDLAPARGDFELFKPEHHGPVGILDLRPGFMEGDPRVRGVACRGVEPFELHRLSP